MYKVDELLLLEILTNAFNVTGMTPILETEGMTVGEYMNGVPLDQIDDATDFGAYMTGFDWKNMIMAIRRNPDLCKAYIAETHLDDAYGAGGGISIVFLNKDEQEAVIAFGGTANEEWYDDFVGANQVDSLQQINALEWYKRAYTRHGLNKYTVTVTGHSKGGNKAKYITVLNDTPDRCVSFDGQGFSDKFIEFYKKRIQLRQSVIENHNIDYDYVNILMNDIGSRTYYIGYDYGVGGFAESHSPNTFFDFGENGEYTMRVNPNGQSPEMQILDQFFNSMIRSGVSDKERDETDMLVGQLAQRAFQMEKDDSVSDYINYLCDMIRDDRYSDNVAYILAFIIIYSRENTEFLGALKNVMMSFGADNVVKLLDMFSELINSPTISRIANLTNFVIMHANGMVVKQLRAIALKKYGVDLTADQIRGLLQIISMTKETIRTLKINMDGSDIVVEDILDDEDDELTLPENLDIVVLAGGLSNERNLSLRSGLNVSEVLKNSGHNVILLDAFMGYGEREISIKNAFADPEKYSLPPHEVSDEIPDLWAVKRRRADKSDSFFGPNVLQICRQCDVVFIALHGANGENGRVQAAFDVHGIDYTGCDYFSSAISSNKFKAKQLMREAGVPVPDGYTVCKGDNVVYPEDFDIAYPVIVKPNNGGIGLGITVANDKTSYRKALTEAIRWDNEVLVEEYISGREFAVGTIDGMALPVIETLPLETTEENTGLSRKGERMRKCPADITSELADKLMEAAETVTKVLGVNAYAKMDFIVRDNGDFVCLECDSLPQLYPDAQLVQEAKAAGMSFEDLCSKILELSLIERAHSTT